MVVASASAITIPTHATQAAACTAYPRLRMAATAALPATSTTTPSAIGNPGPLPFPARVFPVDGGLGAVIVGGTAVGVGGCRRRNPGHRRLGSIAEGPSRERGKRLVRGVGRVEALERAVRVLLAQQVLKRRDPALLPRGRLRVLAERDERLHDVCRRRCVRLARVETPAAVVALAGFHVGEGLHERGVGCGHPCCHQRLDGDGRGVGVAPPAEAPAAVRLDLGGAQGIDGPGLYRMTRARKPNHRDRLAEVVAGIGSGVRVVGRRNEAGKVDAVDRLRVETERLRRQRALGGRAGEVSAAALALR
ncbi:MAG: hypothetical protein M5U18_11900 [Dehalococcoidia bacterium]|nr:hypothetical protein [Dehalococcoidia bacterium]